MNELSVADLEKRLTPKDLMNLFRVASDLRSNFFHESNISVGTYLVGSCTYPEEDFKAIAPPQDMDLIVLARDTKNLRPIKSDVFNCNLTNELFAYLMNDQIVKKLGYDVPKKTNPRFSMAESSGRDVGYVPYGRPNLYLNFAESLPIHLIVQFRSPHYYEGRFGLSPKLLSPKQYSYDKSISAERKADNAFCIIN